MKIVSHILGLTILGAAAPVLLAGAAAAEDYCVVCVSPSAMYRCEIKGTPEGRGVNPKAQLYCITEIAKRGGHESCLVSKSAPVPCPGLMVLLDGPGDAGATVGEAHPQIRDSGTGEPVAETPLPAGAQGGSEAAPATPEQGEAKGSPSIAGAPKNDPAAPKTVEELAGKTVEATKDGISKAGSAVTGTAKKAGDAITGTAEKAGDAAKSTWKCISSFFSNC